MSENKTHIRSRRKILVAIVIIAAVVVAGFIIYLQLGQMTRTTTGEIPETILLSKTDLESKVTASGNFVSTEPVTIGSNVQGAEVEAVFVEVGSRVYEGDIIAKLKTSDIERSIADAEASIAETRKTENQKKDSAQRTVNEANDQYSADDRQTQNAINNAQAVVNSLSAVVANAQTAFDSANQILADADPADPSYPSLLKAVEDASVALNKAQSELAQAQTTLSQAQTARENTLRISNSKRTEAQAQLDALTGTNSARQQLSKLEELKETLANAYITSPTKGIVTQVNTEAGMAAIGTMFVVENTETLQITASIAEFDVIKIEPGMKAHITSNATGDTVYDGIVEFVAPVASNLNGNFEVKVLVTSPIGQLKPGMTATVQIVAEYKDDVFAVPIDAVVKKPDGTKVVYAFEGGFVSMGPAGGSSGPATTGPGGGQSGGGQIFIGQEVDGPQAGGSGPGGQDPGIINGREIVVKTGMETDFFIEIISDELKEGMLILTDPMGRNVRVSGGANMFGMGSGGGTAVRVDTADAGPVTQTYGG